MDDRVPDSSEQTKNFLKNLPLPLPKHFYELNFGDTVDMANTLTSEGECCLENDQQQAFRLFEQALKICGEHAELLQRQAKSLFEYGSHAKQESILRVASKKCKRASLCSEPPFDLWFLWGKTLFELGQITHEKTFYFEAEKKFRLALEMTTNLPSSTICEFFSQLALLQSKLASFSKEAMDWQIALEHYQRAASTCENLSPGFWESYGKACVELSCCINDPRLCVKGIYFFKQAISKSVTSSSKALFQLAVALSYLYDYTHDQDHLEQTLDYFEMAIQNGPSDPSPYIGYITFAVKTSKITKDKKKLKLAITHSRKCYEIDPRNGALLGLWGESLALLGEFSDRLDLILEGLTKIEEAYNLDSVDERLSYNHGQALTSLAKYYNDVEYQYQAIEKFQEGLSFNRALDPFWYAIGENFHHIGWVESDEAQLIKALRFYLKANEIRPCNSYYTMAIARCLAHLGEITDDPKRLEQATHQFTQALHLQKNAIYQHPEWLFDYAKTLDLLGYYNEEEHYYTRALELLAHVMLINPELKGLKYQMAISLSHLGEISGDIEHFYKALHYFKVARKQDENNDMVLVDIGVTHINISQTTNNMIEAEISLADAEYKLFQAAKEGNLASYYPLGCLFSIKKQYRESLYFLQKAKAYLALPPLDELKEDEWLENFFSTQEGQDLLTSLENT
jgi:tetratricopeptide (TPR) repeat protein